MRIHNSSLSFAPTNYKAGSSQSKPQQVLPEKISSQDEIKKALSDNIIRPTDAKTVRAISAYNQTFNAPIKEQYSQIITGIDVYA